MDRSKRLSRQQLGAIKKLNIKFDLKKLRCDLKSLEAQKKWNGLSEEFSGLCEVFKQLPPFFLKKGELPDESASYRQLSLSKFDEKFKLDQRLELSGTNWDKMSPHKNILADERFYRKPINGIPQYLSSVLNYFRPYLHRARFAKLSPHSSVQPHVDYDTTYSCRLHIPIYTSPLCVNGALLRSGDTLEEHLLADGSVYFVNQGLRHWAKNPSDEDRVHLILSVDSQRFLDL